MKRNLNFHNGYFITGTDTDIGKTYISALLFKTLKDFNPGYYKPIQTGCLIENKLIALDTEFVCNFAKEKMKKEMNSYLFNLPLSPHLASEFDKKNINISTILKHFLSLNSKYTTTLVEGAGGIYVPIIRNKYHMYNLIEALNIPVIIVTNAKVGAINHTMLTINFLQNKKIAIQGIIFNQYNDTDYEKDNISYIQKESNIDNILLIKENQTTLSIDSLLNFLSK